MKPTEGPVTIEASVPVSAAPFGQVEVALPVKEQDLPSSFKEKREVSEKEFPESKPPFGDVQVLQIFTLLIDYHSSERDVVAKWLMC